MIRLYTIYQKLKQFEKIHPNVMVIIAPIDDRNKNLDNFLIYDFSGIHKFSSFEFGNIFFVISRLNLNDSDAKFTSDIDDMNAPGRKINIPKTIPLNR